MTDTVNNGIPLVDEGVLDPAAGLNIALRHMDALLQTAVIALQDDPPATPADGDRYLVGVGTGAWAGQDDQLARWVADPGYWEFFTAYQVVRLDLAQVWINVGGWQSLADYAATLQPVFAAVADVTGTTRTLAGSDAGGWLRCTNAAGCAITVPEQASEAWVDNVEVHGRGTTGAVTFSGGTGVTIAVPAGYTATAVAGSAWTLKREAPDSWVLVGQLEPTP